MNILFLFFPGLRMRLVDEGWWVNASGWNDRDQRRKITKIITTTTIQVLEKSKHIILQPFIRVAHLSPFTLSGVHHFKQEKMLTLKTVWFKWICSEYTYTHHQQNLVGHWCWWCRWCCRRVGRFDWLWCESVFRTCPHKTIRTPVLQNVIASLMGARKLLRFYCPTYWCVYRTNYCLIHLSTLFVFSFFLPFEHVARAYHSDLPCNTKFTKQWHHSATR